MLNAAFVLKAQETITTVYGDAGGFFTSSTTATGTLNTYNDSNNLLGFISDGITYSTSVDDATLTSNGISFTAGEYFAFPMPASITNPNPSLIGIGYNWGGVNQTNTATDFIKTYSPIVPSLFVRDGSNGLELATNYFNIPSQTITYDAIVINQAVSINDAKPDIIVTQTGSPSSTDKFKFVDSSGTTVGSELDVVFSGVSRVGITAWTIYRVNPTTGVVTSLFGSNTNRDLRMRSFKLSDFGITTSNYNDVLNFIHTTSGSTDIAFTAYNNDALVVNLPDTEIGVSTSSIFADNFCAPTTATFATTVSNNSLTENAKDFEVEFTLPAGITSTTSSFSFTAGSNTASYNTIDDKWSISGLDFGESLTLTVNATASGTTFPLSLTTTANLLFQADTDTGNNTETITNSGTDNDCDGILDSSDDDDDNDGILDSVEGTGDFDSDGITNDKDLDSDGDQCPDALEGAESVILSDLTTDFVIDYATTGGIDGDGVPNLVSSGGAGQGLGDSQNASTKTCDTTDTDSDGYIDIVDLDDDNDGILGSVEGVSNDLDTDNDADGCADAIEGGASFTFSDIDGSERLTGSVDTNGVPLTATATGQTIGDSQNAGVQSASCTIPPIIISQVYQTASDNAIELTNISAGTISNIKLSLFKDIGASDPTGTTPTASVTITSLTAGNSVVIKSVATLSGVTIISSPDEVTNASVTDISGGNDVLILSTTTDTSAWANRYDVVSDIDDETSLVRIDETTAANTTFTSSEWMIYLDDAIAIIGDADPIPAITRHVNSPLLSEIETPIDSEVNNGLGLHRINQTIRTSSNWDNGTPDKSRSVIIQENYDHTGSNLNARKLDIQGTNKLTIENKPLIVINSTNINTDAEIRILGSGQFIQVHEGSTQVTGNGKLLISQKSEVPNVYRYNYWSSPVIESAGGTTYRVSKIMKDAVGDLTAVSTVSDIDFVAGYDGGTGSPVKVSSNWIWAYFDSSGTSDWVQLQETSFLDEGLGFTMKSTGVNPQYFTFSGTPVDGDISFGVSANTNSLLGNPYAGTLDGNAFIIENKDAIDGTLYFWEHSGESAVNGHIKSDYEGGYAALTFSMGTAANSVVTGTGGLTPSYTYKTPSRYIAIGQGFFAGSDTDGGTINFNNKQRSYQATTPSFFKVKQKTAASNSTLPILKLGLDYINSSSLTIHRQIGISFKQEHTFGFDYGYESRMLDIKPTDLFWDFDELNNNKMVIVGVESINDKLRIPLTIFVDSYDSIFIKIDEQENIDKQVYLFDALDNTSKQIETNELIELELSKGVYKDRFFITFSPDQDVLKSNNELLKLDLNSYVNNRSKKLSIRNNTNLLIEKVEIFNLFGQKLKKWNLNTTSKEIELNIDNLSTSIYITKIKTDKGILTNKVLKE